MKSRPLPSLKAERGVAKLASDIALARRRRKFTQQRLADGAGVGIATVRRLEAGDPGISLGNLMMILVALGEEDRLSQMLDMAKDDVGLMMSAESVPMRVREKRKPVSLRKPSQDAEPDSDYMDGSDF